MLAAAFGLFQAGIVDNSIFNLNYGGYDEIRAMGAPTYVPALGISVFNLLTFVGNHVVFSICAPMAITEGLFASVAERRWLNWFGISLLTLLYAAASWLVHVDVFETNHFLPSAYQIACCIALVALCCIAACILRKPNRTMATIPSAPWMAFIGLTSIGLCELISWSMQAAGFEAFIVSWPGTLLYAFVLLATTLWLHAISKSESFNQVHILYLASSVLAWTAITSILNAPMGNVTPDRKFTHGLVMIFLVAFASSIALRNSRKLVKTIQEKEKEVCLVNSQ